MHAFKYFQKVVRIFIWQAEVHHSCNFLFFFRYPCYSFALPQFKGFIFSLYFDSTLHIG